MNRESWGHEYEEDADGREYYTGRDTFMSGSSEPFDTEKAALKAGKKALEWGDWVQIVQYPGVPQ